MKELLLAAFSTPNLVLTILLAIICFYWLTVILGVIGLDTFDIDIDADVDIDVDIDIDVDMDVDVDADMDVDADTDVATSITAGSILLGSLRFFNLGRVPFMVLFSMFILSMWSLSVYCNHEGSWINPSNSASFAALLFVPITILSLFSAKFLTMPLVPLFKHGNTFAKPLVINGKVGTLLTSVRGEETGQLKAMIDESIVTLMVRSDTGELIEKGEEVVIIQEDKDGKVYLVQRWTK
ncbi:MAG: NfeD family protein [Aureispira sp.]